MKIAKPLLCALLVLSGLSGWSLASAQPVSASEQAASAPPPAQPGPDQYSSKGADTCLVCHGDDDGPEYSAASLFASKHGHQGDKRSPFGAGGLQCESCHGPGALHARNRRASAINTFKPDSKLSLEARNQVCLSCHQGDSRIGWHAGAHERNQLACTDCHKIHQAQGDPVLAKTGEAQVCLSCHTAQRADFHKTSSHPVRQGLMSCSGCHSPHGSTTKAMLAKPTLNQTCYSCHADKRGPLLWEHAPVAEDCSSCHAPHGSVRAALLTSTPPLLCQQCHSSAGHPSVARTSNSLPGGTSGGTAFVVAGSCTNCHSQVHGSNHPSGAKLLR
jgi:DmsE family decaheme c-type cytochrome